MSVPHITVNGRLGTDPEIRTTANGKQVANLFVIADTSRKDQQTGQWEKTESWNCGVTVFGDLAAACQQLSKGMRVTITGKLKYEEYTPSDGVKRRTQKLIADDIAVSLTGQDVQVRKRANNQQQGGFNPQPQAGYGQPQQPQQAGDPWSQPTDPYGGF